MALIAIFGLYFFARSFDSLSQVFTGPFNVFFLPSIPALLAALFGSLYVYHVIKRRPISKTASIIASAFFTALILVGFIFLTVLGGEGVTCPISSNAQQDCGQLNAVYLYLIVNNPVSYGLAMVFSVIGSISLLSRDKK